MTKKKNSLELAPFDAADFLSDDATIAEFLNAALEDGNPDVFLQAARTAARARHVEAGVRGQPCLTQRTVRVLRMWTHDE